MKLINIGFGNMVNADRLIAVVSPDSAPWYRMRGTGAPPSTRPMAAAPAPC